MWLVGALLQWAHRKVLISFMKVKWAMGMGRAGLMRERRAFARLSSTSIHWGSCWAKTPEMSCHVKSWSRQFWPNVLTDVHQEWRIWFLGEIYLTLTSILAAPVCTSSSSVQRSLCSHTLSRICCHVFTWWQHVWPGWDELSGQFGWIRMSKMDRMSEKENSRYRKAEEITGERRVSRT